MLDAIIIGGGVSGLTCAAKLIRNNKQVLIFERDDRVGKKLLTTGNGKCNISNVNMSEIHYNNPLIAPFLEKSAYVFEFMEELGIKLRIASGRIYPYSETAATVLNALRNICTAENIITEEVNNVKFHDGIYVINGKYQAKNVVLSTGSEATTGKNSHNLAVKLGHSCTKLFPSLVPLLTDLSYIKGLAGIRVKAALSLMKNGEKQARTEGELLFKENGLSGIVSMELSSVIARSGGENVDISIDFAPDLSIEDVTDFLKIHPLSGMFQRAVSDSITRQARDSERDLSQTVKDFIVKNARLGAIGQAQTVSGGLKLDEFDAKLESKIAKGFYACGEVLDVDGDCGGYNLHWAFLSGIIAANGISGSF